MSKPQPAADLAYAHLRDLLLSGAYPGGELLSEGTVAAELGISRTPVREAFLRLEAQGFLRLYPKRGAMVTPVTPGEAMAVLQARLLMELFALDSLSTEPDEAVRAVGEDLLALAAREATEGAASPTGPILETARDFHARLMRAGGNSVLAASHAALWDQQIRVSAASTARPAHVAADIEEHTALARALADADRAAARDLLVRHIGAVGHRIGLAREPRLPSRC
ncbi:DNA-binding GntR family transcriptional regulator [Kitasatospora sp. MAP12-15]|uniref:GntR family transcriptional regulator n=1 Tax=unclassified Kitasatospora TaxID=2633591 RepID=UPI0024741648|nr:GntR family transcriptional regulator [Kitasatospora sp. MAP12-44]MDH6115375.1 DNA-binding GntR family transcriptional regulator [Kitasatospora sp. MAP12-44]